MSRSFSYLAFLLLSLIFCVACGVDESALQMTVEVQMATGVAATQTAVPTQTLLATATPFPTQTAKPSATPLSTLTPYLTSTMQPTATPYPSSTPYPTGTAVG
jgi:hypothetical protein